MVVMLAVSQVFGSQSHAERTQIGAAVGNLENGLFGSSEFVRDLSSDLWSFTAEETDVRIPVDNGFLPRKRYAIDVFLNFKKLTQTREYHSVHVLFSLHGVLFDRRENVKATQEFFQGLHFNLSGEQTGFRIALD